MPLTTHHPLITLFRRVAMGFLFISLISLVGIARAEQTNGTALAINGITSDWGARIGSAGVVVLPSGNLVIASPAWNSGKGAVTCLTREEYQAGNIIVSADNSVTGTEFFDVIGSGGIIVLKNGNFLIKSPSKRGKTAAGSPITIGAITWVNGTTCIPAGETTRNALVSATNSFVGTEDGSVGNNIFTLSNGHYVVATSSWRNGGMVSVGAVTWGNGTTGLTGIISPANSLIGAQAFDMIGSNLSVVNVPGYYGIVALTNGNYVVRSLYWDNGTVTDVGAITWVDGSGPITGVVSTANSLVGTHAHDYLGGGGVYALTNGNYVVSSGNWDSDITADVGATTWVNGQFGMVGEVSPANSFVGERLLGGTGPIYPLKNGNYVIANQYWDDGVSSSLGAVTWADGNLPLLGSVNATNSLIGSGYNDWIGKQLKILSNGDYIVISPNWGAKKGAVTWADGDIGLTGIVDASNSLVGTAVNNQVGFGGVIELSNGNYVVSSGQWDDGVLTNLGATTWCSASGGCIGPVTRANSLVGEIPSDGINSHVTALTNGNYVIGSPLKDVNGKIDVGAVTLANGLTGTVGVITAANSLTGTIYDDRVGYGVYALTNGNYIVQSPVWNTATTGDVGAVTWCNGISGCSGIVNVENSLIGATNSDYVGMTIPVILSNGNYVVISDSWTNDGVNNVGAVTWGNGKIGTTGIVNGLNSLVGSYRLDGSGIKVIPLVNGDYAVSFRRWHNVGAIIYGDGKRGINGAVSATNALLGAQEDDFSNPIFGTEIMAVPEGGLLITSTVWDNDIPDGINFSDNHGLVLYHPGPPKNMITNGSFEIAGATNRLANGWILSNPRIKDLRVCSTTSKPITVPEGNCVFQFSTGVVPEKARSLKQILTGGDLGGAGETLTLSVMAEGNKFKQGAKIVLTVTYTDNTTAKVNLPMTKGTYAFTELTSTLNLTKTVQKIVVNINIAKMTGRVRLDELWLTLSDTARLAFPVNTREGATSESPSAPDDFRSGN